MVTSDNHAECNYQPHWRVLLTCTALDNIRPASPILEDRQLLDLSLGVNSQQQRLYQNLGKKIDKINQNLEALSEEQTAMKVQVAHFSTAMDDQMAQLTTLVQQMLIQGQPPAAAQKHVAPQEDPQQAAPPAAPETIFDIPVPI